MFVRALDAIDDGSLDARIDFVFMQRERGEGEGSDAFMDLATSRGIPVAGLSSQQFRRAHDGGFAAHREEYDAQVLDLLRPYSPGLCVLAGYLLILSPVLTAAYRFVNLHPALPDGPVGLWQKVIWDLIEAQAQETGAMIFQVTDELDRGPVLTYNRVGLRTPVLDRLWPANAERQSEESEDDPLFRAIRSATVAREPFLLVETLKAIADGTLSVESPPSAPFDVTERVETALKEADLTA